MEKINKPNNLLIQSVILGCICGIATICILMLICALFMSLGVFPVSAAGIFSTVCLSLGTFPAGFISAVKYKQNGLLIGSLTGAVIFLLFLCFSLIGVRSAPTLTTLYKGVISVLSAALGGILGVNKAGKHKF